MLYQTDATNINGYGTMTENAAKERSKVIWLVGLA